jgi:hypothetical protein
MRHHQTTTTSVSRTTTTAKIRRTTYDDERARTFPVCDAPNGRALRRVGAWHHAVVRPPPLLYLAAIPLAFVSPWIALGVYVFVALMWLVPDRRIESAVSR